MSIELLESIFEMARRLYGTEPMLTRIGTGAYRLSGTKHYLEGSLSGIVASLQAEEKGHLIPVPVCRPTAMHSGAQVHYLHPWMTPIRLRDLRFHLERATRYNNTIPVSVLYHSALVCRIAQVWCWDDRLVALCAMHDFTEAYLGEDPGGKKDAVPDIGDLEDLWTERIHERFEIALPNPEDSRLIKKADLTALCIEMALWDHPLVLNAWQQHGAPKMHDLGVGAFMRGMSADELWQILYDAIKRAGGDVREDEG